MPAALAVAPYPNSNDAWKRVARLPLICTVGGGNGTLTIDTARSASGFSVTGTAGTYTGTMPTGSRAMAKGQLLIATPTGSVVTFQTIVPLSGTFSFTTGITSAAAIADGSEVWLEFSIEGG